MRRGEDAGRRVWQLMEATARFGSHRTHTGHYPSCIFSYCLPARACFRFRLAARIDDDHLHKLELGHHRLGHDEWVEVRLSHTVREFVEDHDHLDRPVEQFQETRCIRIIRRVEIFVLKRIDRGFEILGIETEPKRGA